MTDMPGVIIRQDQKQAGDRPPGQKFQAEHRVIECANVRRTNQDGPGRLEPAHKVRPGRSVRQRRCNASNPLDQQEFKALLHIDKATAKPGEGHGPAGETGRQMGRNRRIVQDGIDLSQLRDPPTRCLHQIPRVLRNFFAAADDGARCNRFCRACAPARHNTSFSLAITPCSKTDSKGNGTGNCGSSEAGTASAWF